MNSFQRSQFNYNMQGKLVSLYGKVTFGAAGAPTLSEAQGIASIVRNSAGNYSITLQDKFKKLLQVNMMQLNATAQAAPIRQVISELVSTTKVIVIQYYAANGTTATDPASGELLELSIMLNESSVPNG